VAAAGVHDLLLGYHSKGDKMKRIFAVVVLCFTVGFIVHTQAKSVPSDLQQALIALDKQWGQAGADTAKLDKIIGDNILAIGPKGEAQGKQELIAANTATSAGVQNASYEADEYKFEMLSPDVVVMTHRGTTKGTQDGKDVTESHRSLHVFQKQAGGWRVVANAQLPIQ
jgi:ketosteroid isomerase-like protein